MTAHQYATVVGAGYYRPSICDIVGGHRPPLQFQNGPASPALPLIWIFAPRVRRVWPSVTTISSGSSPFSITASPPTARLDTTGRGSTVLSDFTTYTNVPF